MSEKPESVMTVVRTVPTSGATPTARGQEGTSYKNGKTDFPHSGGGWMSGSY